MRKHLTTSALAAHVYCVFAAIIFALPVGCTVKQTEQSQEQPATNGVTITPKPPVVQPRLPEPKPLPTEVKEVSSDQFKELVERIEISPATITLPLGTRQQLELIAIYKSGHKSLISEATWSATGTATFDASLNGVVVGSALGTGQVQAVWNGLSTTANYIVSDVQLDRLEITPTAILIGTTNKLYATGVFTDGSRQDFTDQVTWQINNQSIISFDPELPGNFFGKSYGSSEVTARLGQKGTSRNITVRLKNLKSIELVSPGLAVILQTQAYMKALGHFEDGSVEDITNAVVWTSDDTSVVSFVSPTLGLIRGNDTGSANITATIGDVSESIAVTVAVSAIDDMILAPAAPKIPLGLTFDMKAFGMKAGVQAAEFTSNAIWRSDDLGIATISNALGSAGRVVPVTRGTVLLSARYAGFEKSVLAEIVDPVLVKIDVTPEESEFICGVDFPQLVAHGTYSDGTEATVTHMVTWSSSNELIAVVSNEAGTIGKVTFVAEGEVTIKASYTSLISNTTAIGEAKFTIKPGVMQSLTISSSSESVPQGTTIQFSALGIYSCGDNIDYTLNANWSSADTANLTIENGDGKGASSTPNNDLSETIEVEITATHNGFTGKFKQTVRPAEIIAVTPYGPMNIEVGQTGDYGALGSFSNGSTTDLTNLVTWTLGKRNPQQPVIALIDNATNKGRVTGVTEEEVFVRVDYTTPEGLNVSGVYPTMQVDRQGIFIRSVCPPEGTRFRANCFFLGAKGLNCHDACIANGAKGFRPNAIGNIQGMDNVCQEALNAVLDKDEALSYLSFDGTPYGYTGVGCSTMEVGKVQYRFRVALPVENYLAADPKFRRLCSCDFNP